MARESGVRNRDKRCRTMKGRVGGELEELRKPKKFEALEKCSEPAVLKFGAKQLNQTRSW